MHDIDPLDRFHCALCGQAWVVPSLARLCAERDREAANTPVDPTYKPKRVKRP